MEVNLKILQLYSRIAYTLSYQFLLAESVKSNPEVLSDSETHLEIIIVSLPPPSSQVLPISRENVSPPVLAEDLLMVIVVHLARGVQLIVAWRCGTYLENFCAVPQRRRGVCSYPRLVSHVVRVSHHYII